MKEQFASAFAIGLVAVAVAVGAILFMQRGAHVGLTGPMSVRTIPTDPNTALAVIDLRITNPADYDFEVSNVTVTLETKDGEFPTGIVSRVDAQRLFDAMPDAGPFHPTLYTKAIVKAHSTGDYTLLAQYSAPERILQDRKQFVVRIQEINGKVAEFSEK
jgi:hypothetical protein